MSLRLSSCDCEWRSRSGGGRPLLVDVSGESLSSSGCVERLCGEASVRTWLALEEVVDAECCDDARLSCCCAAARARADAYGRNALPLTDVSCVSCDVAACEVLLVVCELCENSSLALDHSAPAIKQNTCTSLHVIRW